MNAERLLEVYEHISDAPDAIRRMRRFVLDLAVRGKLVEQDAGDEPASVLVKFISKQKQDETRSPGISKIPSSEGVEKQDRFDIPPTWQWVPAVYPAVGVSDKGKKVKTKDVLPDGLFPVVDQGKVKVRGFCNDREKVINVSQPLIIFGDHTRETKFIDFDFVVGADGVKILRPVGISPKYFHLALTWLPLDSRGYGRHFKLLKSAQIPLPPLAEQHRIVAKVDELMALCDRLEEARKTLEEVRDKLTAASLARLTAPDTTAEDFPTHAAFALEAPPAPTTRPDQIKTLRQTILNLAVRGKLVEQDPTDEHASNLMKVAKELQAAEGVKVKADPIQLSEVPFQAPYGWLWTRVGIIALQTGSGSTPRGGKSAYADEGTPFLRSQNIYDDGLRLDDVVFINDETNKKMKRTQVKAKDLLLNITGGSIGRCTRVADEFAGANVSQHVAIIRTAAPGTEDYLHLLVRSPLFQEYVAGEQTGAGRGGLPKNRMDRIPVPLPPLAEQQRILAKVDALMALCDRLEPALTTTDTTRTRLLEALLHEALEPAIDTLKAAE